jgi:hypothetical protein
MIIVTVRVGWQDDMMQLDPEGTTGESEQQYPTLYNKMERIIQILLLSNLFFVWTIRSSMSTSRKTCCVRTEGGGRTNFQVIDIDDENKTELAKMHSSITRISSHLDGSKLKFLAAFPPCAWRTRQQKTSSVYDETASS